MVKILRLVRMARPLRLISKNLSLQIAVMSVVRSMPKILKLQALVIFFNFMVAIVMTNLYSGALFHCYTEHLELSSGQGRELITTKWDCLNYGGEWINSDFNFDRTKSSMTTIGIISQEGWV